MAKLIACGPLSDETEEALHLNYKGGMLKDFLRTNDFAIQLQESNRQLRARIATLEKDNGDLILDNSHYVDDNTKLLNEAEALRDKIAALRSKEATMPERRHCACKFSSGGVPNQLCQWHLLFIEQQIAKSQEATVMECAEACDKIIAERTAIASRGDEGAAYEADWTRSIKAAILSRFGLKGERE